MSTPAAPRSRTSTAARAARAGEGSRRTWIIVAVVLVVAFAGILAVALASEEANDSEATAEVDITGDALPQFDDPANDAADGQLAPALTGTGLDGQPLEITPGDGTPKVIAFFAHWCPVCQDEVPLLVDWIEGGNAPADVDFYGVSTGVDPVRGNYPPGAWFDREGWEQPTLVDDSTSPAARAYGLTAYPYFVALDAEGRVVQRATGALPIEGVEELFAAARTGA